MSLPASGGQFRSLTIVLPAFNEEARLGPALDELFAYLDGLEHADPRLPAEIDVLVVDDGSTDGTAALVRGRPEFARAGATEGAVYRAEAGTDPGPTVAVTSSAAAGSSDAGLDAAAGIRPLRLLSVPHAGKGSAVRSGVLAARGELIVFADADMATPPDQLPLLVVALGRADVALGSRVQPDGSDMRASQPPLRRLLGRTFRFAARLWVTGPVDDTQCGFKGFRARVARDLFSRQRITSIVFDVELIYLARRRGYRLTTVPVVWADRRGSRMHARPRLALRVAWDLFRIPLVHRGVRPLSTPVAAARDISGEG